MMDSKTRAKLRSYANTVEAILQVGKNGMGEALQKQVDDALTARELIKLTVLETAPETPREMAATLASPFTTAEAGAGSPWGVRLPSTRMSSGLTPSPSTARFMASIVA